MGIAKSRKSKASANSQSSDEGPGLIENLVGLTGLPREVLKKELKKILEEAGHRWETLTLDQLRKAMMVYLNRVFAQGNATRLFRR